MFHKLDHLNPPKLPQIARHSISSTIANVWSRYALHAAVVVGRQEDDQLSNDEKWTITSPFTDFEIYFFKLIFFNNQKSSLSNFF
jgi:hypothetical protein